MTPINPSDEFMKQAAECQRMAKATRNPTSKATWNRMAERYKDFFEFDPQFKLWLATNNLPSIAGTDDAIWRRIMVIPFPVTIPPRERDKTLVDRLITARTPDIGESSVSGSWRALVYEFTP